jgi:hypothetical protein
MKKKTVAKKMASEMLNDFKNVLPMAGFDVIINEFVKMITSKFEIEMSALPEGPEKEKQRRIFKNLMADELDGLNSLIASEHQSLGEFVDKQSEEAMGEVEEYFDGSGEGAPAGDDDEIDEKTAAEMTEKFKKASRKKMEDELFKPMLEDFKKTFLND